MHVCVCKCAIKILQHSVSRYIVCVLVCVCRCVHMFMCMCSCVGACICTCLGVCTYVYVYIAFMRAWHMFPDNLCTACSCLSLHLFCACNCFLNIVCFPMWMFVRYTGMCGFISYSHPCSYVFATLFITCK